MSNSDFIEELQNIIGVENVLETIPDMTRRKQKGSVSKQYIFICAVVYKSFQFDIEKSERLINFLNDYIDTYSYEHRELDCMFEVYKNPEGVKDGDYLFCW